MLRARGAPAARRYASIAARTRRASRSASAAALAAGHTLVLPPARGSDAAPRAARRAIPTPCALADAHARRRRAAIVVPMPARLTRLHRLAAAGDRRRSRAPRSCSPRARPARRRAQPKTWSALVRGAAHVRGIVRPRAAHGGDRRHRRAAAHVRLRDDRRWRPGSPACRSMPARPLYPADLAARLAALAPRAAPRLADDDAAAPARVPRGACARRRRSRAIIVSTMPLPVDLARDVERDWHVPVRGDLRLHRRRHAGNAPSRRRTSASCRPRASRSMLDDGRAARASRGGQLDAPLALVRPLRARGRRARWCSSAASSEFVKIAGKRTTLAALTAALLSMPGVRRRRVRAAGRRRDARRGASRLRRRTTRSRCAQRSPRASTARSSRARSRSSRRCRATRRARLSAARRAAARSPGARARRRGCAPGPRAAEGMARARPRIRRCPDISPGVRCARRRAARAGRAPAARARHVASTRCDDATFLRAVAARRDAAPARRARRRRARALRLEARGVRAAAGTLRWRPRGGGGHAVMSTPASPAWLAQKERGSALLMATLTRIALSLGRPAGGRAALSDLRVFHALLGPARRASRDYLARVLGRAADAARALSPLPRVRGDAARSRVPATPAARARSTARSTARTRCATRSRPDAGACSSARTSAASRCCARSALDECPVPIRVLMHERHAQKMRARAAQARCRAARAGDPARAAETMLDVRDALARGEIVALLADRSMHGERHVECRFLGAPAAFPRGPFELAAMLDAPVVLFSATYRGRMPLRHPLRAAPDPAASPASATRPSRRRLPRVSRRGSTRAAAQRRTTGSTSTISGRGRRAPAAAERRRDVSAAVAALAWSACRRACHRRAARSTTLMRALARGRPSGTRPSRRPRRWRSSTVRSCGAARSTTCARTGCRCASSRRTSSASTSRATQLTIERRSGRHARCARQPAAARRVDREPSRDARRRRRGALRAHFDVRARRHRGRMAPDAGPARRCAGARSSQRVDIAGRDAEVTRFESTRRRAIRTRIVITPRERRAVDDARAARRARGAMSGRVCVPVRFGVIVSALAVYAATRVRVSADFSAFLPAGADAYAARADRSSCAKARPDASCWSRCGARRRAAPGAARASGAARARSPRARRSAMSPTAMPPQAERDSRFIEAHRYALSPRVDAGDVHARTACAPHSPERLEGLYGSAAPLEKRAARAGSRPARRSRSCARSRPPAAAADAHGVWFDPAGSVRCCSPKRRRPRPDLAGQADARRRAAARARGRRRAGTASHSPAPARSRSRAATPSRTRRGCCRSCRRVLIVGVLAFTYRASRPVLLCAVPAAVGLLAGVCAVYARPRPPQRHHARVRRDAARRGGRLSELPVHADGAGRDAARRAHAHRRAAAPRGSHHGLRIAGAARCRAFRASSSSAC